MVRDSIKNQSQATLDVMNSSVLEQCYQASVILL